MSAAEAPAISEQPVAEQIELKSTNREEVLAAALHHGYSIEYEEEVLFLAGLHQLIATTLNREHEEPASLKALRAERAIVTFLDARAAYDAEILKRVEELNSTKKVSHLASVRRLEAVAPLAFIMHGRPTRKAAIKPEPVIAAHPSAPVVGAPAESDAAVAVGTVAVSLESLAA